MDFDTIHKYDVMVDARNDTCPMPLLKTKMALAKMQPDAVLCVLATDKGSIKDIPYYLTLVRLSLLEQFEQNGAYVFFIKNTKE